MGFLKMLKSLFSLPQQEVKKEVKKPRRYIKDVLPGEEIRIEWYRIKNKIGFVKCMNNDPETQKIFLQATWGNYKELGIAETELLILDYNSDELKNFHLLNEYSPRLQVEKKDDKKDEDDFNIIALQAKLNLALDEQRYEDAEVYQKKIDKLAKKQ